MTSRSRCDRAAGVRGLRGSGCPGAPPVAQARQRRPPSDLVPVTRAGPSVRQGRAVQCRARPRCPLASPWCGALFLGGCREDAAIPGGDAERAAPQASVGADAGPEAPHRPASNLDGGERRLTMVADSPRNDQDHIRSAISFIALQHGGPQRVLAHHQKMPNGLCGACSSVNAVAWPCPIVSMAMQADVQQRAEQEKRR
jgi:hypothetical protein